MSKESNPYYSLFHGEKRFKSQLTKSIPHTLAAVDALLNDGSVIGQETLPDPDTGKSDTLLYMPRYVKLREEETLKRLEEVQEELRRIQNG